MRTVLGDDAIEQALSSLPADARLLARAAPEQPLHTVYVRADRMSADLVGRWRDGALDLMARFAPDIGSFGDALGIPDLPGLRQTVYAGTLARLQSLPIEDLRIDFEDGYGVVPDGQEDIAAAQAAAALAHAIIDGQAPPSCGIRVKALSPGLQRRCIRTTDLFLTTLLDRVGKLPAGFAITLPKVIVPQQVTAFIDVLEQLEEAHSLPDRAIALEIMVEDTRTLMDPDGCCPLPAMHRAARGRLRGAHIGTFDFTASAGIAAPHQALDHPICELARQSMTAAFRGTIVQLSDGATNVLPAPPHAGVSVSDLAENRGVVHHAWRLAYKQVNHSLRRGWVQGWDLHPGQLPVRFAANLAFHLQGLPDCLDRLRSVGTAAGATDGSVADDAATAMALERHIKRAVKCGAVSADEVRQRCGPSVL